MNFVQIRYSSLNGQNQCGIAQGDPLSMWLFCITIDDVLKQLTYDGLEFVAYADDLLISVTSVSQVANIIEHCAGLFGNIGLSLNVDKCESTENGHEITFMGVQFGLNTRNLAIADRLLLECKIAINEYEQYIGLGINRNVILQFVTHSLVSRFNFGAFIDLDTEEGKCKEIDDMIAGLVSKVFNTPNKFKIAEWVEFCAAPTKAGGLGLMLPGYYFSTMNIVNVAEDNEEGFATYHRRREKSDKEYGGGQYDSSIAVHSFKNYYSLLQNDNFDLAFKELTKHSDFHFKEQRAEKSTMLGKCIVCGNVSDEYHYCKCKGIQGTIKN
jgi:hypothetical protein